MRFASIGLLLLTLPTAALAAGLGNLDDLVGTYQLSPPTTDRADCEAALDSDQFEIISVEDNSIRIRSGSGSDPAMTLPFYPDTGIFKKSQMGVTVSGNLRRGRDYIELRISIAVPAPLACTTTASGRKAAPPFVAPAPGKAFPSAGSSGGNAPAEPVADAEGPALPPPETADNSFPSVPAPTMIGPVAAGNSARPAAKPDDSFDPSNLVLLLLFLLALFGAIAAARRGPAEERRKKACLLLASTIDKLEADNRKLGADDLSDDRLALAQRDVTTIEDWLKHADVGQPVPFDKLFWAGFASEAKRQLYESGPYEFLRSMLKQCTERRDLLQRYGEQISRNKEEIADLKRRSAELGCPAVHI